MPNQIQLAVTPSKVLEPTLFFASSIISFHRLHSFPLLSLIIL